MFFACFAMFKTNATKRQDFEFGRVNITGHLDWLHLVTIVEGFLAVGVTPTFKCS